MQRHALIPFLFSLCLTLSCASLTEPAEQVPDPGAGRSDVGAAPSKPAPVPMDPKTGLKKKLIVLPFTSRTTTVSKALIEPAHEKLRTAIAEIPGILLVGDDELQGQGLISDYGDYQMKKVFAFAVAHGASGVIGGNIDELETEETGDEVGIFRDRQSRTRVRATLDVYEAQTEQKVYSRTVTTHADEEGLQVLDGPSENEAANLNRGKTALLEAVRQLALGVPKATERISWMGHIAKIQSTRYFVTGGERVGLKPGQLLKVLDPGSAIVDPATGETLGFAPGRMKGLLRVIEPFGSDASVAILHSGAGFRERDRVELFSQSAKRK